MEPTGHTLEIKTLQPVHAVCSCGLWSMYCAVKGYLSDDEALLEAREAHDAHLLDVQVRARLLPQIKTKK